jgi:nicotinate dehydrogenase subunit A
VIELKVNGRSHNVSADPDTPLLYVLRDDLQLNAAKFGCGLGQCGSCTVLVDGAPTLSCVTPIMLLEGRQITTLEGLGSLEDPGPLQRAFIEEQAAQCGYCIPGMMMRAQALLQRNPHATDAEIRAQLEPNLCRCGTHMRILRAVRRAATLMAGPGSSPGTPPGYAPSAAGPQLDTPDTEAGAQGDARSRPAYSERRERPER